MTTEGINLTIGQRIKQERKKQGLSQAQLAERCSMFDSAIRKYESGKQVPKIETLERISKALNVPISIFYQSFNDIKPVDYKLFSESQIDLICHVMQLAIANHDNLRPAAFIPTKQQVEILKEIVNICNQNM